MNRRRFLASSLSAATAGSTGALALSVWPHRRAALEVVALRRGMDGTTVSERITLDVEPGSNTFGQIVGQAPCRAANRPWPHTWQPGGRASEFAGDHWIRVSHPRTGTYLAACQQGTVWQWTKHAGRWQKSVVLRLDGPRTPDRPQPGRISDAALSPDGRSLYLASWSMGEIRQYDLASPGAPRLAAVAREVPGPQLLGLSPDGQRLFVVSTSYGGADAGSCLLQIECQPRGGLAFNHDFRFDLRHGSPGPRLAGELSFTTC
jgi:hypothetical protein